MRWSTVPNITKTKVIEDISLLGADMLGPDVVESYPIDSQDILGIYFCTTSQRPHSYPFPLKVSHRFNSCVFSGQDMDGLRIERHYPKDRFSKQVRS